MNFLSRTLVLAGSIAALTASVVAEDWPQWGGNDPGRNMYAPVKGMPSEFDPGKFKPNSEEVDISTTKNVKWVVKLGSQTYGNPVVASGKVKIPVNQTYKLKDARKAHEDLEGRNTTGSTILVP